MEFSHQGLHCQYSSCHQRDFLPFDCRQCSSHFCLAHRTRDQHECPSLKAEEEAARRGPPPPPTSLPPKFKCHYPRCKVSELISLNCRNCAHNFCIKHRFPTQHACESFGKGGIGRNTILPAGIVPARPLDKNNSSNHSTAPIAAAPTRTPAVVATTASMMPLASTAAATPIAVSQVLAAPLPSVTWETAVSALSLSSANTMAAESAIAEAATAVRTPSPLHNHGSSCAAEMAQVANAAASSDVTTSSSGSKSESTAATTAAAKRHNTNVAHLSKLLKQHS